MAADQEKSRSLFSSCRRGGVVQEFLDHTTPSAAPFKGGFAALFDVAATPPPAEEGGRLLSTFKALRQFRQRVDGSLKLFPELLKLLLQILDFSLQLAYPIQFHLRLRQRGLSQTSPDSRCA